MAKPQYIGLTGLAGTGKDTVREMLERDHDYVGMAFADPIRTMLRSLLQSADISTACITERELKEQPIAEIGTSYRHLAQTLGTEWGRAVHPDLWVRIATARIQAESQQGFSPIRFVFSDVRFPNEVEMIRERGGEIWRIERPGTEPVRSHESEQHAQRIRADRVIHNTGSIESLWCRVSSLVLGEGVVA